MGLKNKPPTTIRAAVIAAAKARGMTAYAISKATGGAVSIYHLQSYLNGEKDMTSGKLDAVMRVLGLTLTGTP